MSMVICEDCDRPIDSDDDPECFIDMPCLYETMVLCENCRERRWERDQERLMEDGPGPSLLDQQIAALPFK